MPAIDIEFRRLTPEEKVRKYHVMVAEAESSTAVTRQAGLVSRTGSRLVRACCRDGNHPGQRAAKAEPLRNEIIVRFRARQTAGQLLCCSSS